MKILIYDLDWATFKLDNLDHWHVYIYEPVTPVFFGYIWLIILFSYFISIA